MCDVFGGPTQPTGCRSTEPAEVARGLLAARTLVPDRLDHLPIQLLNTTDKTTVIPEGTPVSQLETVDPVTLMTGTAAPPPVNAGSQGTSLVIEEMLSCVDQTTPKTVKRRF